MAELKPCPFCGSIRLKAYTECVQCTICGAKIERPYIGSAIDAWNKRS